MAEWRLRHEYRYSGGVVRHDVIGDGPPLVMVHGTPFSSYVWRKIAPVLAESHKVHLFDLLGYGASEKRDGQDVSLGVQNRVLSELLDLWELDAPDIVGHDFGGATVLRTHLLSGRDFRRMALIDPVALAPWGSPFVHHVQEHEDAFGGLPAYIHEAVVAAYVRNAVHRRMTDGELEPYVGPWTGSDGQPGFYRQIAQMDQRFTDEVEPRYGEIARPVLILWGEEDAWIPIETGRRLNAAIPGSRFQPIANAGHLVQEDNPSAVADALLAFFAD